eukprot:CAMPEP_0204370766 /NCGR_PEP_ID=MMETSP0469-20131031/45991_1 /ASSEMBLY_ACC=CAM_ASM_000384 /TAXON_ID=2969 /ORGANISM="Oxyrrhis marina" /LENGTH=353 /DNA_ID=CAMNT_0051360747 /DNA_START=19 /DNA_END=1080 /DNA_ORIENTATION=-
MTGRKHFSEVTESRPAFSPQVYKNLPWESNAAAEFFAPNTGRSKLPPPPSTSKGVLFPWDTPAMSVAPPRLRSPRSPSPQTKSEVLRKYSMPNEARDITLMAQRRKGATPSCLAQSVASSGDEVFLFRGYQRSPSPSQLLPKCRHPTAPILSPRGLRTPEVKLVPAACPDKGTRATSPRISRGKPSLMVVIPPKSEEKEEPNTPATTAAGTPHVPHVSPGGYAPRRSPRYQAGVKIAKFKVPEGMSSPRPQRTPRTRGVDSNSTRSSLGSVAEHSPVQAPESPRSSVKGDIVECIQAEDVPVAGAPSLSRGTSSSSLNDRVSGNQINVTHAVGNHLWSRTKSGSSASQSQVVF